MGVVCAQGVVLGEEGGGEPEGLLLLCLGGGLLEEGGIRIDSFVCVFRYRNTHAHMHTYPSIVHMFTCVFMYTSTYTHPSVHAHMYLISPAQVSEGLRRGQVAVLHEAPANVEVRGGGGGVSAVCMYICVCVFLLMCVEGMVM